MFKNVVLFLVLGYTIKQNEGNVFKDTVSNTTTEKRENTNEDKIVVTIKEGEKDENITNSNKNKARNSTQANSKENLSKTVKSDDSPRTEEKNLKLKSNKEKENKNERSDDAKNDGFHEKEDQHTTDFSIHAKSGDSDQTFVPSNLKANQKDTFYPVITMDKDAHNKTVELIRMISNRNEQQKFSEPQIEMVLPLGNYGKKTDIVEEIKQVLIPNVRRYLISNYDIVQTYLKNRRSADDFEEREFRNQEKEHPDYENNDPAIRIKEDSKNNDYENDYIITTKRNPWDYEHEDWSVTKQFDRNDADKNKTGDEMKRKPDNVEDILDVRSKIKIQQEKSGDKKGSNNNEPEEVGGIKGSPIDRSGQKRAKIIGPNKKHMINEEYVNVSGDEGNIHGLVRTDVDFGHNNHDAFNNPGDVDPETHVNQKRFKKGKPQRFENILELKSADKFSQPKRGEIPEGLDGPQKQVKPARPAIIQVTQISKDLEKLDSHDNDDKGRPGDKKRLIKTQKGEYHQNAEPDIIDKPWVNHRDMKNEDEHYADYDHKTKKQDRDDNDEYDGKNIDEDYRGKNIDYKMENKKPKDKQRGKIDQHSRHVENEDENYDYRDDKGNVKNKYSNVNKKDNGNKFDKGSKKSQPYQSGNEGTWKKDTKIQWNDDYNDRNEDLKNRKNPIRNKQRDVNDEERMSVSRFKNKNKQSDRSVTNWSKVAINSNLHKKEDIFRPSKDVNADYEIVKQSKYGKLSQDDKPLRDNHYGKPLKNEKYEKPMDDKYDKHERGDTYDKSVKDDYFDKPSLDDKYGKRHKDDDFDKPKRDKKNYKPRDSMYKQGRDDYLDKPSLSNKYGNRHKDDDFDEPSRDEKNYKQRDDKYDKQGREVRYDKQVKDDYFEKPSRNDHYDKGLQDDDFDKPKKYKKNLKNEDRNIKSANINDADGFQISDRLKPRTTRFKKNRESHMNYPYRQGNRPKNGEQSGFGHTFLPRNKPVYDDEKK